jgi:outer membrane protein TolC
MLVFQLRQPLLRDAGRQVNLAGVNVAQLQHLIALEAFRERAQSVSAEVIIAYWRLAQALRYVDIQRETVAQARETLQKVEARREIDATDVQLMQVRASAKLREANLLEFEKQVSDAQDVLARLLADPLINTTSELRIVPVTAPEITGQPPALALAPDEALAAAMAKNSIVRQAQIGVEIADLNVQFAENQRMPRLDLVASTRAQGLDRNSPDAHEQLAGGDYLSYEVGVILEIPLGNRRREAELTRRRLERRKAVSILQNAADQIAVRVKEKARKARTRLEEIEVQQEAAEAAAAQLQALKESAPVRERLTPEFLLVELQAQDTQAEARRVAVDSLIEFNVALVELAHATGTVFELQRVEKALTTVTQLPADTPSGE